MPRGRASTQSASTARSTPEGLLKHDWKLAEPRQLEGASGGGGGGRKYRYKFQVVLTTYEMVVAHPEPLRQVKWQYVIVDEGHRLKNRQSRALDELRLLRARRRLVLTGTPLQNHVTELWTILNYLAPKKFDDLDAFLDAYGSLSTGGGTVQQVRSLSKLLGRTCSGARRPTSRRYSRCRRRCFTSRSPICRRCATAQ